MNLNEKLVNLYNEAAKKMHLSFEYKDYYDAICKTLELYASNNAYHDIITVIVPFNICSVLCDDLRAEGLNVYLKPDTDVIDKLVSKNYFYEEFYKQRATRTICISIKI